MESTNETQTVQSRLLNLLIDKGLTFVVLGVVVFIMYNWVEQGRIKQDQQLNEMRNLVEDCARSKKEKIELEVEKVNMKVDRILNIVTK
jgi:hypothetical protein